jgi:HK97 family phage portal protein
MGIKDWFKPKVKGISDTYFDLKRPATALLGGDATTLVNEYQQLPVVYAAVNAIAMRAASVDPKFYRVGTDTEVESHPAIDRLMRPAMGWNWPQFIQAWVISKKVYGEFLARKSRDVENNVPVTLKITKYGNYKPSFDNGAWSGWTIDGVTYGIDEVLYDKYPNPWDEVRGLSPLFPARVANETEWAARRFNKRFFDNDATPGGYFKSPMGLTEPQRQRLKNELIESRKGRESAHSWLLLEGDTEVTQLGLSHRDSQFIEQFSQTLHDVCGVLQVDPACIGFEKESKYASAKEARKYLWTDAVLPTLRSIESVINRQFLKPYSLSIFFDTEGIEALQDNFHETVSTAEKLWKMGVPFNALNERFDMGFEPIPGGDEPRPSVSPMMLDHEPQVKEAIIGSLPDNGG